MEKIRRKSFFIVKLLWQRRARHEFMQTGSKFVLKCPSPVPGLFSLFSRNGLFSGRCVRRVGMMRYEIEKRAGAGRLLQSWIASGQRHAASRASSSAP